jgi:hypothetical protein
MIDLVTPCFLRIAVENRFSRYSNFEGKMALIHKYGSDTVDTVAF